jgi:hypothetical protein
MLSAAENEVLTRVGLGTPMGVLMRLYWCAPKAACVSAQPAKLYRIGSTGV